MRPVAPPAVPQRSYVALVTPEGGGGPALVVEVDFYGEARSSGTVRIQSLQVEAPAGRSLELWRVPRSEEHTSELQSLMRNSNDVFCWKKTILNNNTH